MQSSQQALGITHDSEKTTPHLLVFDLSIRGHHPNYIRHLIRYWHTQTHFQILSIVVSPRFLTEHADVVEFAEQQSNPNIRFIAITHPQESALKSRKKPIDRNLRNLQEWRLFCDYASQLQVNHGLIMYLDTYFLSIAWWLKPPCSFSGIYFRPTLHYRQLGVQPPLNWRQKLNQGRENLNLNKVLRNSRLATLFCLDPLAVPALQQRPSQAEIIHLPDPVEFVPPPSAVCTLKDDLGIESERTVFLLFGAIDGRKGIHQILDAIQKLSSDWGRQLCLVLVGESKIQQQLEARITEITASQPVQIIRNYQFVSEEEVWSYFRMSDVILATYQKHVGMSGILLLAAATQKPVLSTDFGLMGAMVKQHQLGLSIDSTQPEQISEGMMKLIGASRNDFYNPEKMRIWAKQNSAENFAQTIFAGITNND